MPKPRNKQDLLKAGEEYYAKLIEMADEIIRAGSFGSHFSTNDITNNEHE